MSSGDSFTLIDNRSGKKWVLPLIHGTQGPSAIDVRNLYNQVGLFLYDPGYTSTACCDSALTYIDGDIGMMQYGGYPIEQLAEESTFLETSFLLLHGELPSQKQYEVFTRQVMSHAMIHEQIRKFIEGFRRDAHPMAVMIGIVGALSAFYNDPGTMNIKNPKHRMLACIRLIAKMPTIAAWCYKYTIGQPFVYPNFKMGFAENFLTMMFATPCEPHTVSPVLANALEKIMILHADHEQNQSTSTVRVAGSSHVNPFACIAAGIAALWGPHHGGANEAALRMLEQIGSVDRIPMFLAKAKDKNDPFRLMGFGHRVYKNFDPRGKIIKEVCHEVLEHLGKKEEPLFKLAIELERIALEDEYFVTRKLYPNIDFYSGILLHAMGMPTNMFTVIFAMSRCVGWVAQWKEMIESPEWKLSRPRQVYTGATKRNYISLRDRPIDLGDEKVMVPKSHMCE